MTNFLNTRILLSGATILAAAVVIVGATLAFFSDVETSEANAFTAGDVQVAIGSLVHTYQGNTDDPLEPPDFTVNGFSFTLDDLKPLDWGEVSYVLNNQANDAHVCAMVEEVGNAENGRNDSEIDAGDTTGTGTGPGEGELQNFMSFKIGSQPGGPLSENDGDWFSVGTVNSGGSGNFAIGYCFGEYDGTNCEANTTGDVNVAQTDGMTADISFYAVQTRNNEAPFDCATLNEGEPGGSVVIDSTDDLAADLADATANPDKWFMYNDSNDTIDNTLGTFVAGPGTPPNGTGSIEFVLGANPQDRKNIATYGFGGTVLSSITSMSYGAYSTSGVAGPNESPFFHFNVDFDGDDDWQRRLVYVPSANGAVPQDAWNTFDMIDGGSALWTWSGYASNGNQWPTETGAAFADNTAQYQTWSDILAAYPGVRVRVTDPWLGVRVGEPGPTGYVGNVDFFEMNSTVYDFDN